MRSIEDHWYKPSLLAWLLLPLSWLYCIVVYVRRKLYQCGILKSFHHDVPVVIIGNITVGGTGKTPLIIAISRFLKDRGIKVGIVSRGYGGDVSGVHQVDEHDQADQVGDEPLLILRNTGVPVVVGADRVAAVDHLLSNNPCDIVLSDDGLQHYRLQRRFEVVVIDSSRGFGNGFCLPAGPLRERRTRLKSVDMIVYNEAGQGANESCAYTLRLGSCCHLDGSSRKALEEFSDRAIHAVAGIGNPQRFFDSLRKAGLTIIEHPFPDHHRYTLDDFSSWRDDCIIMTEKDAVKCQRLSLPDAWSAGTIAVFSEELERRLTDEMIPLLR